MYYYFLKEVTCFFLPRLSELSSPHHANVDIDIPSKMKLTIASLLVGSAAAFAPTAPISGRNSALNMVAAGTATEGAKVRLDKEQQKDFSHVNYPISY